MAESLNTSKESATRWWWSTRVAGAVVYALVLSLLGYAITQLQEEGGDGKGAAGSHAAAIRACVVRPTGETLEDVGGLESIKEALRRAVLLPLRHPEVFYRGPKALRPPRGVLLHGPPGTGKTMLARALASESGVPLVALTSAALESKWWGESSKLIEAAFRVARTELQPCILFFDELDGMGRARSEQDQACTYSFKTELLRNLDGVEGDQGAAVMVLACTNCPQALDPALRRRFPRVLHVDKPDARARLSILHALSKEDAVDAAALEAVARVTVGSTGADLAALYAAASAARFDSATAMDAALQAGADGAELVARAGALGRAHWLSAGVALSAASAEAAGSVARSTPSAGRT